MRSSQIFAVIVLASIGCIQPAAAEDASVFRAKVEVDGKTYDIRMKGGKLRARQLSFITKMKVETLSRFRRAVAQALPNCTVHDELFNGEWYTALMDCPADQLGAASSPTGGK